MIALHQSLSQMTLCFVQAIVVGTALGLWYDLLHGALGGRGWRDGLCDGLFWLAALGACFVFTVTLAGGQVRGYTLMGMLGGAWGMHMLLGKAVRALVRAVRRALWFTGTKIVRLLRIASGPVRSLWQFGQKNLEKIAKRASISDKKKI